MLLTLTTTHTPATDLGYLLYKHPDRCQHFELSCGRATVFYPEASPQRCTCALLLAIDPVGLVRGGVGLSQYVNDRPYTASSFLSVAIARVFSSALAGQCRDRPELVATPLPLVARIAVLPCRGGESFDDGHDPDGAEQKHASEEMHLEKPLSLNEQRLQAVISVLAEAGAKRVVDLGCGEGRLLGQLLKDSRFEQLLGMDVSWRSLEIARERLHLDQLPESRRERIELVQGSLTYRDSRLAGFDAATVVEVIEHLDPHRLASFERVLFECVRAPLTVVTTPNIEYNVRFAGLPAGCLRHRDHRFEWSRAQFQAWAEGVAGRYGLRVRFAGIGPEDAEVGTPTQMGVFQR